jgi:hypothetical protein
MIMTQKTKKVMAHTRYKNADGVGVVGTTTVLNRLSKPALVPWANRLGLEGVAVGKYVDEKASIGTLAHEMIHCMLKGEEADTSDYSQNQIDLALNSLKSFINWHKDSGLKSILLEEQLISEKLQYGGSIDCYGTLKDGTRVLVDFKTGKAIYGDMAYQLSAYANLLEENGYPVSVAMILNIPRADTEDFYIKRWSDLTLQFNVFKYMLDVYKTEKSLKKDIQCKELRENTSIVDNSKKCCNCCGKPLGSTVKNAQYCKSKVKGEMSKCQKWGKSESEKRTRDKKTLEVKSLKKEKNTEVWCLKCGKNFKSLSKFNRVCEKCAINNNKRVYRVFNLNKEKE